MDEGYSKSGLATMEDVQEWLMQGLEMVVSRDEVFTQEMEALNAKKCELVEAQQAREKKLKAVKENLVMLENVRREKEIEVMKFHQVFASLPKNLLQAMASKSKDMVTPAGDSHGVKRKWMDFDQLHEERKEQMNQPSTPINKVLPRSQPQFSHDSKHLYGSRDQMRQPSTQGSPINSVPPRSQSQFSHDIFKRTWGESRHMFKSGDPPSTPINKVLAKSHSELSHDSYIMKRKLMESKYLYGRSGDQKKQPPTQGTPINKVPLRLQPQYSHESNAMKRTWGESQLMFKSGDQPSTPGINKVLAKSQPELSHDSYIMKRKLVESKHKLGSGDQPSTPINKVLSRFQSQLSQDSYISKRKLVVSKHLYGSRRDQMRHLSTPNNMVLPRSQPQLSPYDSPTMKTKLEEWETRHFSTPTNKVLPRLQPQLSHDCNSQSLSSDLETGGMMQELRQQSKEKSHKFKNMVQGQKGAGQDKEGWRKVPGEARNSAADWGAKMADIALFERKERVRAPITEAEPRSVQGENMFYGAEVRNQTDRPTNRRAFHDEARAPLEDCSPSLNQSRAHKSTSTPQPQRSTSMDLVLQNNVASVRVTSSSYHLKSILKKR